MTNNSQPYNITMLRKLLDTFDDPDLDAFCMDNFPDVFDKFSRGLRHDEKVSLLLDHCRRKPSEHGRLVHLLTSKVPSISVENTSIPPPKVASLTHHPETAIETPPTPTTKQAGWIVWALISFVLTLAIVYFFAQPFRCLLEYRLTEAIVGLIVALVGGAATALSSLAPPNVRNPLRGTLGGITLALIVCTLIAVSLPKLTETECFPAPTPTATPVATPVSEQTPQGLVQVTQVAASGVQANTSSNR